MLNARCFLTVFVLLALVACSAESDSDAGSTRQALIDRAAQFEADGEDPYVVQKYAEALTSLQRYEEGTRMFEKVVESDPGFVSGVYRLARQYTRARQPDKAKPLE